MNSLISIYTTSFKRLLPLIKDRPKTLCITAAILLVALQQIHSFFYVPKSIRSIPKVSYLSMAISFLYREGPPERLRRLKLPAMRKGNGFYLVSLCADEKLLLMFIESNPFRLDSLCRQSYCCQAALIKSRFVLKQRITTVNIDLIFFFLKENFPKSHFLMETVGKDSPFVQFLGPDNVVNSNGESWKKQRKVKASQPHMIISTNIDCMSIYIVQVMNPAFHRSMPVKTIAGVIPTLFAVIDKYEGKVPVTSIMQEFTLDVLGLAIFSKPSQIDACMG